MSSPRHPLRTIRVLAADDSAVMRHWLSMLFDSLSLYAESSGFDFQLIATVADGVACIDAARSLRPDIVLLDIEMPRVSGMEALRTLHADRPSMPIIMCSASTERGAAVTLEALSRGATDYVTKPTGGVTPAAAMASLSVQLLPKLCALAETLRTRPQPSAPSTAARCKPAARPTIIAIGSSTGGPAALETVLSQLPENFPLPIVIAQHMPRVFTRALAMRLDSLCALSVREAVAGVALTAGHVWLAPGDRHMEVARHNTHAEIVLHDHDPLRGCRPAVDLLFASVAEAFAAKALAVVLTGMGCDGLAGARALAASGAAILAQDQATSAVWGMPRCIAEAGIAAAVLPLHAIAPSLLSYASARPTPPPPHDKDIAAYAMQ